jgi:hypothetical protein
LPGISIRWSRCLSRCRSRCPGPRLYGDRGGALGSFLDHCQDLLDCGAAQDSAGVIVLILMLALELQGLAGRKVTVRLAVNPGSNQVPLGLAGSRHGNTCTVPRLDDAALPCADCADPLPLNSLRFFYFFLESAVKHFAYQVLQGLVGGCRGGAA